jgi:hypothetical protein
MRGRASNGRFAARHRRGVIPGTAQPLKYSKRLLQIRANIESNN